MPHPNSGSMRRSPLLVDRMRNIDSSIRCSYLACAMLPVGVTCNGNFQPMPRKSRLGLAIGQPLMTFSPWYRLHGLFEVIDRLAERGDRQPDVAARRDIAEIGQVDRELGQPDQRLRHLQDRLQR